MVFAAATAEACMSAGSTVGVAFVPHALNSSTSIARMASIGFVFMAFILPFSFLPADGCGILIYRDGEYAFIVTGCTSLYSKNLKDAVPAGSTVMAGEKVSSIDRIGR